ncbi:MAG: bifunctional 5,10-methylenetetrahydrofolate dehydrogenase/5,10-methenyltetrahydrofolate cyclohydrolase [Bacilli bacterium]|nr:bifunctional 5,10-methylenetetrahydrofolate dehydrogenase/5,10-methenyltetrahydrofolate cyclohydrolase [Bacilli bacterium]
MQILDGKGLSAKIKDELKSEIDAYVQTPILAVISIGDNEASKVYVKNKKQACEYVGMSFMYFNYASDVKEKIVINKIKELNKDKSVNGIILQLPIPENYDVNKLINTIDPEKDIDGLTFISQGKLYNNHDTLIPCTPKGIMELLKYYNIDLTSKNVVIVGRSNLVSKPLYSLCLKNNATVTMCHTKTKDLKEYTKRADILIVATGHKYLIDKSMVKKDAVIVDVGITRENSKLYGDVNPDVKEVCSYLTPVPGGVGPMTVAMILKNTFEAYKKQHGVVDIMSLNK